MLIGLPREIKDNENRVGLTPGAVKALVRRGHRVLVQQGRGRRQRPRRRRVRRCRRRSRLPGRRRLGGRDGGQGQGADCRRVPATCAPARSSSPICILRPTTQLTLALLESGVTGIAYETVQTEDGKLPAADAHERGGRAHGIQVGATYLERSHGGRGMLLGGVPGVAPANVAILGGGDRRGERGARGRGPGRAGHRARHQP